ncbi:MAG: GEVED domain-containing protein [Candidatus Bipolaricaulis sp.]|nr:GEVED domain-containing protein [Candidatus Bipolaricaulis sp.]
MKRKMYILVLVLSLLVTWVAVSGWLTDRHTDKMEVGWSPLYDRRVADALVPVTSHVAYAGLQSVAYDCKPTEVNCNETWDCYETRDCNETWDCQPTSDCESAAAACGNTSACIPTAEKTCSGTETCDAWPTCAGAGTCAGASCPSETFDAFSCGPTGDAVTCVAARTCDARICDWPTYEGPTCTRPTCDGPTCVRETCEGPTCFLMKCDVFDYGDAPQIAGTPLQYSTTQDVDGARHLIDGVYYLGAREDAETDGQPAALALGDDDEPYGRGDDEDGIWFASTLNPGRQAVIVAAASQEGRLFAWVDYDMSGAWREEGDAVFSEGTRLAPGYSWVVLSVPETAAPAPLSYVRFRFTASDALLPTGVAENGEVEDYRVPLCASFRAWVMTDQVLYTVGERVEITFYVNEVSQVTVVRHRADGTSDVLWTSTVEAGRHEYPSPSGHGSLVAAGPEGTSTVEVIATSLQSATTVWLTTPYLVTR